MVFPIVAPTTPMDHGVNNFESTLYQKAFIFKYDLFWCSGSREEDFSMTPPHFGIFVIISPLKRTWPFI